MPDERQVLAGLRRALPELLPTLDLDIETSSRNEPWDLVLKPKGAQTSRYIVCEVRSVGEPRYIAQAITTLSLATRENPDVYPIIAAPYISPEGQRLCRESGIGYIDLVGNAFLRFDGILIERVSSRPPRRAKARLRRLFAPKSSRIARVLLENLDTEWTQAKLAEEAGVSIRTAHMVVNALAEKGFVVKRRGATRLDKPADLLDLWAQNYDIGNQTQHTFYTFMRDIGEISARLASHASVHRETLALTLHSGAALVAPFVRSPDIHAYFIGDRERLATELDFRPVVSGGTIHLLEPYDEGVFYQTQKVGEAPVVCNSQLYLDLINYPARGPEQAAIIRSERLGF